MDFYLVHMWVGCSLGSILQFKLHCNSENIHFLSSMSHASICRFYLLAEHQGCAADSSRIFDNTRNMSTLWLYVRLAWCMPYHATHHAWPGVPFHRLKEATSLYLVSQGDEKGIKSKCTPSGDDGYVLFNYNFIDTLKTERENKNKY